MFYFKTSVCVVCFLSKFTPLMEISPELLRPACQNKFLYVCMYVTNHIEPGLPPLRQELKFRLEISYHALFGLIGKHLPDFLTNSCQQILRKRLPRLCLLTQHSWTVTPYKRLWGLFCYIFILKSCVIC